MIVTIEHLAPAIVQFTVIGKRLVFAFAQPIWPFLIPRFLLRGYLSFATLVLAPIKIVYRYFPSHSLTVLQPMVASRSACAAPKKSVWANTELSKATVTPSDNPAILPNKPSQKPQNL